MDISDTLAPTSDQLDSVELTTPRIFTVEKVTKGSAEQPVNVWFVGFPRPWRPGKSMRRVLGHPQVWGTDASKWPGRSVELFCDPTIPFGGKAVGGTRIKRISHIDKPVKVPLLVTRGKTEMYVVDPLPDTPAAPAAPSPADINACVDRDQLRHWWQQHPNLRDVINQRVTDLDNEPGDAR